MTARAWAITGFLAAIVILAGLVWALAFRAQLDEVARRGGADLAVAEDRLVGQLQRYRGLAVQLASHPTVRAVVDGAPSDDLEPILQLAADRSSAFGTFVTDATGRILAHSNGPQAEPQTGPHVTRALRHAALGSYHSVLEGSPGRPRIRAFAFAAPIHRRGGPPMGAVVVQADVGKIEADWRGDPMTVFFTDELGVVFAANRSELLLRATTPPEGPFLRARSAAYVSDILAPFLDVQVWQVAGQSLWRITGDSPYLPRWALHIQRPLPVIEMTGEALVDIGPALRLAALPALATAALCLIFGAALLWLAERRRALAERLALEAQTSAELERRVVERTSALSAANLTLRREVAERLAAEAALRQAQHDLVQAEKLGALGRMSADIAHELNQPLMAIRSFAENGRAFLDLGRSEAAGGNLGRIGELADRMDRIIRNLRAFARAEAAAGPQRPVDFGEAVDAALDLAAERISADGVTVEWERPSRTILVNGGDVRLAQVVGNLIANALDAMTDQPERRLTLRIEEGPSVRFTLADTGTGLAEADRIFEPFYSTKFPGGAEGLGLGLSISYAIIQSFGGTIRGSNLPAGGALFSVELPAAQTERVA